MTHEVISMIIAEVEEFFYFLKNHNRPTPIIVLDEEKSRTLSLFFHTFDHKRLPIGIRSV